MNMYPGTKIVISSTWREIFNLDWLKAKLASYHIDCKHVIDKTPAIPSGNRGLEIAMWLEAHPEVDHYIIIDDNDFGISDYHPQDKVVKTSWDTGFTTKHLEEAIIKLKSPKRRKKI